MTDEMMLIESPKLVEKMSFIAEHQFLGFFQALGTEVCTLI